jgi:hypothetical protein
MTYEKNNNNNNNNEVKTNEETAEEYDELSDLLSEDTMLKILKSKNENKTQFESHWEQDENDISNWTKVIT